MQDPRMGYLPKVSTRRRKMGMVSKAMKTGLPASQRKETSRHPTMKGPMKHSMMMHSYPMQHPSPGKMHTTGKHHISAGPKKTGQFSSGGGTGNSHGVMKKVGRKRRGFSMPRPDRHGYY